MYDVSRTGCEVKKCGYLKLTYCKELLCISLQAFQWQFIQTELLLVIKQNIFLNWIFSVDAHFYLSDPELC